MNALSDKIIYKFSGLGRVQRDELKQIAKSHGCKVMSCPMNGSMEYSRMTVVFDRGSLYQNMMQAGQFKKDAERFISLYRD